MNAEIIAPDPTAENPHAEADARLIRAGRAYRALVAAGEDPAAAAYLIDLDLGLIRPPAEESAR